MGEIAAYSGLIDISTVRSPGAICLLVVERNVLMDEIENTLDARPARGSLTEEAGFRDLRV
ncbi:hypothetical protein ABIB57_005315 [Devosia sp. UYZn731]